MKFYSRKLDREKFNDVGSYIYTYRYKYNLSKGFIKIFISADNETWWYVTSFYRQDFPPKRWRYIVDKFREFKASDDYSFKF